mgnify:FL=1|tara:strand:+ start:486 stop:1181 length:696 start_codon:yes stop_codon:yes gene_type:complete
MKYLVTLMLLCSFGLTAQDKTYVVKKTQNNIIITGEGSDKAWGNANSLIEFSHPWLPKNLPSTTFKSLWSKTHFYFLYTVEDHEIITPQRGLGELDAVESDRVEIFFKAADEKKPYYSLEMDALGRCLDSDAEFYKNNIDFDWNWPKNHIELKASQHKRGYIVEGSISLESLRELGIYNDDGILRAGLYRGEYYSKEDDKIGIKWISWVVANPDKPVFHIPTSFGILELEN